MKILQILPELNLGGVERGTVDLVGQLVLQGHQALVISNGGKLATQVQTNGGRHISLPVHKKSLFSILSCIPKVARILKQEQVDLVHARSRVPALIAFLACRASATPFITTCHGYYSPGFFSRVMGWGKRVIVSSNIIGQHMNKDFGVPQERIRLIPRGVDLEKFKFLPKSPASSQRQTNFTIGVVGRLTPIKGHKYFLQAMTRIIRTLPSARAMIVGESSPGKERYKEELLILTRRLSLDRYVEFLGQVDNVPQVLSRLDALVLPTVTQEAFGRALIEAAACGVPIVASRVGGVTDIIEDGVNGILVEPKNPAELASALIRLYQNPKLVQKLIAAARERVEQNFSLRQMAQKTIEVYEETRQSLKILVIKFSALGDVVLAVPSLRALRQEFPRAQITVLTDGKFRPILQHCPYINQVLEFPLTKKGKPDIWPAARLLRREDFDLVIDLQNNRSSHLLAYLSACNRRYGYDNGKFGFLLNRKVKELNSPLSPIKHQERTLNLLGIESLKEDLELWPQESDESWAEDFLNKHQRDRARPLIGVNLGASPGWPSKRLTLEQTSALLEKIDEVRMQAVITGQDRDSDLAEALRQICPVNFIDAVGASSVMQLACLIKRCQVYVSADSAPLHLAYAMKTPVVALFGPTDPKRHALWNAKQAVIKKTLACSPCYKRRCPDNICMKKISAEDILTAVQGLLTSGIPQ